MVGRTPGTGGIAYHAGANGILLGCASTCENRITGLGNALRKIRVDLGISIDFSFPPMGTLEAEKGSGKESLHGALGRIRCSDVDGQDAAPGTILYIKPVLNGNETADTPHYAARDPRFPQQPTLTDQACDES